MLFVEQEKTNREFSIFTNDNNYYYWGAFSKALNRISNYFDQQPKWIIICNNDITFSKDFFIELNKIDNHHHIVAPSIISTEKNEDLKLEFKLSGRAWIDTTKWLLQENKIWHE
mgnify:CR=1 FL=1